MSLQCVVIEKKSLDFETIVFWVKKGDCKTYRYINNISELKISKSKHVVTGIPLYEIGLPQEFLQGEILTGSVRKAEVTKGRILKK